jgi:hypothetical protein
MAATSTHVADESIFVFAVKTALVDSAGTVTFVGTVTTTDQVRRERFGSSPVAWQSACRIRRQI